LTPQTISLGANALNSRGIVGAKNPGWFADFLAELTGFEPLISAVLARARLTGSGLPFLRGSSATAKSLSPKPLPAPAECDRSARDPRRPLDADTVL
jgi:hypothetical protein